MVETSKISPNVVNLAMPRGSLSFAPINDDGDMTGEIDLGNVTGFELTNALEYKEHMTSHDAVVVLDAKKISAAKWTAKFTPEELSAENMALFLLGDPDKQKGAGADQTAQIGAVMSSGAAFSLFLDRWCDLGKKYIKPGTLNITDAEDNELNITELTSGNYANYAIDYENGLIMIKSGNTANIVESPDDSALFACTYGTCALRRFVHRIRPLQGFLRYRGISEVGPRHSVQCWKVQMVPDAAMGFIKPQDYASLGFTADVFIDDDTNAHRATDPFFKIEELSAASSYPLS
jgi:hypothetical protein